MAIKKSHFILGFLILVASAQAQISSTGGSDWKDSSLIPPSRLAQHNEFLNNQYTFPAKPRNQWELGIKVGSPTINGDVTATFPNFGFGIHVRKSIGYIVSLRAEFNHGTATGLNWKDSYNYMSNPAWRDNGYNGNRRIYTGVGSQNVALVTATDRVFYNYKTNLNDLSGQMLFNLSNIRFHKAVPKFGLYAILGAGVTFYEAKVDALNASGQKYNFNGIPGGTWATRNDTKDALKSVLDGTYETAGDSNSQYDTKFFGKTARMSGTVGFGAAFKLSKRVNIAIEDRLTFLKYDLLDAQRWAATPIGDATPTTHYDTYNFISLGININLF